MNLMRQAVAIIDHLTTNHRDIHNKRSLELTEAKIRRLGNYYKAEGKLSADWKYKATNSDSSSSDWEHSFVSGSRTL